MGEKRDLIESDAFQARILELSSRLDTAFKQSSVVMVVGNSGIGKKTAIEISAPETLYLSSADLILLLDSGQDIEFQNLILSLTNQELVWFQTQFPNDFPVVHFPEPDDQEIAEEMQERYPNEFEFWREYIADLSAEMDPQAALFEQTQGRFTEIRRLVEQIRKVSNVSRNEYTVAFNNLTQALSKTQYSVGATIRRLKTNLTKYRQRVSNNSQRPQYISNISVFNLKGLNKAEEMMEMCDHLRPVCFTIDIPLDTEVLSNLHEMELFEIGIKRVTGTGGALGYNMEKDLSRSSRFKHLGLASRVRKLRMIIKGLENNVSYHHGIQFNDQPLDDANVITMQFFGHPHEGADLLTILVSLESLFQHKSIPYNVTSHIHGYGNSPLVYSGWKDENGRQSISFGEES